MDLQPCLLLRAGWVGEVNISELNFSVDSLFRKSGTSVTLGINFGGPVDNLEYGMSGDLTSGHKFHILADHAQTEGSDYNSEKCNQFMPN